MTTLLLISISSVVTTSWNNYVVIPLQQPAAYNNNNNNNDNQNNKQPGQQMRQWVLSHVSNVNYNNNKSDDNQSTRHTTGIGKNNNMLFLNNNNNKMNGTEIGTTSSSSSSSVASSSISSRTSSSTDGGSNGQFGPSYFGLSSRNSSDYYSDTPYRIIATALFGGLSIIGITGNILVITVVFRVRGMLTPTNCYLVSLAASDCLFFFASVPAELQNLHTPHGVYVLGKLSCKLLTACSYLGVNISSLSIAAFTIERYIGICHPMRAKYLCTVKRAKVIIFTLWILAAVYSSSWLYLATTMPIPYAYSDWPSAESCTFKIDRSSMLYKGIFTIDIFGFYLVPMMLYFILYGRIAHILIHGGPTADLGKTTSNTCSTLSAASNNHISDAGGSTTERLPKISRSNTSGWAANGGGGKRSVGSPKRAPTDQQQQQHHADAASSSQFLVPQLDLSRQRTSFSGQRDSYISGSKGGRIQVIKMLAVIVIVFGICWLPYRALVFINSFTKNPWVDLWYILFAKTMLCINCAINPILYNLMSAKFRAAFRQLLSSSGRNLYGGSQNGNRTHTSMGMGPPTQPYHRHESTNAVVGMTMNNNNSNNGYDGKAISRWSQASQPQSTNKTRTITNPHHHQHHHHKFSSLITKSRHQPPPFPPKLSTGKLSSCITNTSYNHHNQNHTGPSPKTSTSSAASYPIVHERSDVALSSPILVGSSNNNHNRSVDRPKLLLSNNNNPRQQQSPLPPNNDENQESANERASQVQSGGPHATNRIVVLSTGGGGGGGGGVGDTSTTITLSCTSTTATTVVTKNRDNHDNNEPITTNNTSTKKFFDFNKSPIFV